MRRPLAIIGMSPGNSYFKDYEVRFLLKEAVNRFGRCVIMVADVPAISTYMALGYSRQRARNKAIPKGNNLKNRTRRLAEELGYSPEQVRIIDWANEIDLEPRYQEHYRAIRDKFDSLPTFATAVRMTTRDVLANTGRVDDALDGAAECAAHYLLSELAFLEFAPEYFGEKRV
ncbi:MAG: tRNA-dependent cyclodipeptide synthase, partial [Alphaproteobacteria bacterium]|nr:tRNA-dependent cyclodipeptide synthase [Alphaproteobacteria bacterium]